MAEALELNEEQRRYLLSNAESLVFVDGKETVDGYKCINCDKIAIKHHMTNCKHIFCSKCIREVFYEQCPICLVKITMVTYDAQVENGLAELNVECQYKTNGCQAIIPLYKYQGHNKECKFSTKRLLPKVYEGPSPTEKFNELEEDIRQLKTVIKEFREDMKKEDFQKETGKALTTISEKIEIMSHDISQVQIELEARKECERKSNEKINAIQNKMFDLIASIGTTNKLSSEYKLNDDERDLQLQGNTKVDPDEYVGQGIVFSWKIDGFTKKWENINTPLPVILHHAERGQISQHLMDLQFHLGFSVHFIIQKPNILICLSKFPTNCIFPHAQKFTLVDQSGNADKISVSFINTPLFSRNADLTKQLHFRNNILAPISLLENHFDAFVKDDSLLIEICIIPLTIMYKSVASKNGIFLWRIDNYTKKKEEEIEGISQRIISNSFYTANQGYRVEAYLYLDGDGHVKGKNISIYIDFVKGEFDNSLRTPFIAMAKFFLRDQSNSSIKQHVYREITFHHNDFGSFHGITDFVKQSQAEDVRYLKEDALLFKIMVQIIQP